MSEECVTRLDWLNKTGASFTVLQTSTYNNHVKLIIKDTNTFGRCIQNSLVSDGKMTQIKCAGSFCLTLKLSFRFRRLGR